MRNNSAPEAVCPAPTRTISSSSVAALLVPRSLVPWLRLVRVSCSWRARLSFAIAFAVKFSALGEWQKFIRSDCPKLFEIAERARYAGSINYMGPQQIEHRDLPATTLTRTPIYTFYHPRMQTSPLQAAESAGAEVRRGTSICAINQGTTPSVTHRTNGSNEEADFKVLRISPVCSTTSSGPEPRKGIFLPLSKRARSPLLKAPAAGWNVPMPMAWRS